MAIIILISPRARSSYLAISAAFRSFSTTSPQASSSTFHRSDFSGQGFSSTYEPGQPTPGPLGNAAAAGSPRLTPKALKQHLDQFVVGQERAKKVLSVAVYNHYQRIQELQRLEEEEEEEYHQQLRRDSVANRHPVEDEFPGQQATVIPTPSRAKPAIESPINDASPLTIEKSNVMMLGPSGVGKTLMAKTLARILEVPFSMSDCTPFTQAGYIGEDAEICVSRLLAASNYDVSRCERGIICLDEIDKIATAKVSHGKDVSGEGVQQALLKIIEGTTLQITAKSERGASGNTTGGLGGKGGGGHPGGIPPGSGIGGSNNQTPGKNEVYNVRTDNILFIFTGAFIGLQKIIMDRISKGSIGFGAPIRSSGGSSSTSDPFSNHASATTIRGEEELYKKYLPFFTPNEDTDSTAQDAEDIDPRTAARQAAPSSRQASSKPKVFEWNPLDLVEPSDLQKYGLIPELLGRIPITTSLSSLSIDLLTRVLTEPRNSLLSQYIQLFALSGIELRFTTPALRAVAKTALDMGTGARGLRTVMERLLGETMFETPGSSVKYVLVDQAAAERKSAVKYFGRGMQGRFLAVVAEEEGAWERENVEGDGAVSSFEQFRERERSAGYA